MINPLFSTALCLVGLLAITSQADPLSIAKFSQKDLSGWQSKSFIGETDYQLIQDQSDWVLQAHSQASASAYYKEVRIDLKKTPFLNWRWQIKQRLGDYNEQVEMGDDFAARVYVIASGGVFLWKTMTLNYVWANNTHRGNTWPNPFAEKNSIMMALRTMGDDTSTWYVEKRNVWADLKQQYGKEVRYIDAVAVMTDTDNNQLEATALYGDIYFSAH